MISVLLRMLAWLFIVQSPLVCRGARVCIKLEAGVHLFKRLARNNLVASFKVALVVAVVAAIRVLECCRVNVNRACGDGNGVEQTFERHRRRAHVSIHVGVGRVSELSVMREPPLVGML